ncbi:MAG: glycoside hydrolase family 130 protein [Methylacidiphilales bacterium]|nr:glycoside hydrolase family 130 protein [Candidatus Methylacidiphilales bacterium]
MSIQIRRRELQFLPDASRVLLRPFIQSNPERVTHIIERALSLDDDEIEHELAVVLRDFGTRHLDLEPALLRHFAKVQKLVPTGRPLSKSLRLLIGALFTGEYSLESAALFNPSIVPHPYQGDMPDGSLRFILSLRAVGEGHVSSIEFRTGVIDMQGGIKLDVVSRHVVAPDIVPNPTYNKAAFTFKLNEMGFQNASAETIMSPLKDNFTLADLDKSISVFTNSAEPQTREGTRTLECVRWLAESNYDLSFSPALAVSERIIFPVSPNESNGIEDARFVRFTETDGTVTYYATYTAYNGRVILPQLIETHDFLNFHVRTLNGSAVQNKGMALFPRRINGRYAMISRQDDENLFIMFSDNPHFWNDPATLLTPAHPWELVKIGNCGSPIETEAGWLVLTHGVGPMRRYCIGAILLDLNDPSRVIGRLDEPLIRPEESERDGYVPNVVYTCGALLHGRELILPYALSDKASVIASVSIDELLEQLHKKC